MFCLSRAIDRRAMPARLCSSCMLYKDRVLSLDGVKAHQGATILVLLPSCSVVMWEGCRSPLKCFRCAMSRQPRHEAFAAKAALEYGDLALLK
jgi:hypothetical protein